MIGVDMVRWYDIELFDVKGHDGVPPGTVGGVSTPNIVDATVDTWAAERSDIDFRSMHTVLRLGAVAKAVLTRLEDRLAPLGLAVGEFDVLATLRRNGRTARVTPTEIAAVTMISPSGLTNRLLRLEKMGLIAREADPADRRSSLVHLTPAGRRLVDQAIEVVAAADDEMIGSISDRDRAALDRSLARLLDALSSG
jgi:DNA-binding MarR family transcriptional regulator